MIEGFCNTLKAKRQQNQNLSQDEEDDFFKKMKEWWQDEYQEKYAIVCEEFWNTKKDGWLQDCRSLVEEMFIMLSDNEVNRKLMELANDEFGTYFNSFGEDCKSLLSNEEDRKDNFELFREKCRKKWDDRGGAYYQLTNTFQKEEIKNKYTNIKNKCLEVLFKDKQQEIIKNQKDKNYLGTVCLGGQHFETVYDLSEYKDEDTIQDNILNQRIIAKILNYYFMLENNK